MRIPYPVVVGVSEMPFRQHKMRSASARPPVGRGVRRGSASRVWSRLTSGARSGIRAVPAALAMSAALTGIASAQGFAGSGWAPREATAGVRVSVGETPEAWIELALDALELARVPIRSSWASGEQLRSRLAPESSESFHVIGPGGRHWIHAVRWSDPIAVEFGLQKLGSRPMGAGRFRLPALGLELAIAGEWLLVGPHGCPWLDAAVDKASLHALDRFAPDLADVAELTGDLPRSPIELVLRHADPIGGVSAVGIRPTSPTHAALELAGRYAASPLPIRTVGNVDLELAARFDGRVAFATIESGIGLLDPLMIRHAARHPELVPAAELRRRFASQRIVVLDGQPAQVDPLGIIEVPAACVAVPMRRERGEDGPTPELAGLVDTWIESAGRAIRADWSDDTSGAGRTRGSDIRHLSLGPGLLEAGGGHPMAVGASLNWTLHATSDRGVWLVAGTSPGLVRRVVATLDERRGPARTVELAGAGVASPARIALQISELAQLRELGDDPDSRADAAGLNASASLLDRFERISWRTMRQDEHVVRATAEVRLVPSVTRTTGSRPR